MKAINFLGLELKNPVIIAAGPWNRDGAALKESIASGAGAVVTESIVSDTMLDVRPRIACDEKGAQNIRLYSDIQIEGWEREIGIAKRDGGVVIASVSAHTPSELAYLASKLEKFGADAIEISISNPAREALEVMASHADVVYEMTKEVVSAVKLPVMVKLSQNTTNISKVAKAVKAAGGSGVSAINAVRGILGVDVEAAQPVLSTYGGISGEYIRPLGLASVATISQTVDLPICGIGGITCGKHVLEYMMLGASAVQVGTTVMLEGRKAAGRIVRELEEWLAAHQLDCVDALRGKALSNLKSFDEMKIEPAVSTAKSVPCTANCSRCMVSCLYGAIEKADGAIHVDSDKCTGCGLCTFICPAKKLKLAW